jgi:hypothetical protein
MRTQIKILNQTIQRQDLTLKSREETVEKLLNRLQAGDLKTLLSLNTDVSTALPDTEYRSSHDIKELEILSQGQGLGMGLYDDGTRDSDEFLAATEELGIRFSTE